MKIVVNKQLVEDMTLDEMIALQEGDLRTLKETFGRFVQNGNGEYLDAEAGAQYIGSLSMKEITAILNGVGEQMKEVVPNE